MRDIHYVIGPQAGSTVTVEDQQAVSAIAEGIAVPDDANARGQPAAEVKPAEPAPVNRPTYKPAAEAKAFTGAPENKKAAE